MLFKKSKGFTLIELLAVIVILAVLMLFAGNNIIQIMNDARKSSFQTEFLQLLESAQLRAQSDMMYGNALQTTGNTICYCIGDGCSANTLTEFENNSDYKGSVLVTNKGSGELEFKGWMYSTSYKIEDKDSSSSKADVSDLGDTTPIQNCGVGSP